MTVEAGVLATRVDKLEEAIVEIRDRLGIMAVDNATRDGVLAAIDGKMADIKNTTQQTNDKLLGLLEKTMDKKEASDVSDKQFLHTQATTDKQFYQRLVMWCIAIFGTLVAAAFGIKEIIKLPV